MEAILSDAQDRGLPLELCQLIHNAQGSQYLDALALATLDMRFTDLLLPLYHDLIIDIAQRWIERARSQSTTHEIVAISCVARVLPFASYIEPIFKEFLAKSRILSDIMNPISAGMLGSEYVQIMLLALFRLLSHNPSAFKDIIKPVFLCSFVNHQDLYIRYLAIQCFCQIMGFADAFCQRLVHDHVSSSEITGPWEGQAIDYRLLKLFEECRWKDLRLSLKNSEQHSSITVDTRAARFQSADLSSLTASVSKVLLPKRGSNQPVASSFVGLPTALISLRAVAQTLHQKKPTLLVGPSGSGKTAIIRELASQVGALSSMITLHLNDQTDAKSLLGIYTSSDSGAGFSWQPGVLVKAVQDGLWVVIEDIDRAPAEVLGLLRPLIENDELYLPSRKEKLTPKDGFRLFGTVRSSVASSPTFNGRSGLFSNRRLWSKVETSPYGSEEIAMLLESRFQNLQPFLGSIMTAHTQILKVYSSNLSFRAGQSRIPSTRELLKWCHRLSRRLLRAPSPSTAPDIVPETFLIDMLKDGMECYAAHLSDDELYQMLADSLAECLNIPPTAARHALRQQNPIIQQHKSAVQIGRSLLSRITPKRSKDVGTSSFALTRRVRQNMEIIATATAAREPVLLVGETGVGKTTLLQHIASSINQSLTVVNLSNQSEASDLLGGLKPVTTRSLLVPLVDEFDTLFDDTFSTNKNEKFRQSVSNAFAKQKWQRLIGHWDEAVQLALNSLLAGLRSNDVEEQLAKRRKVDRSKYEALQHRWETFRDHVNGAKSLIRRGESNQVFAFVESRLIHAVRNGFWLLLDEINLASSETLDNILSLLHNGDDDLPYILLTEAGDIQRIDAHPNFRIFAAMNPATDTGKKDLPHAVRSHFTEIYVHTGDTDVGDLVEVIQAYLGTALDNDQKAANDHAKAYLALKQLSAQQRLTDGAGDLPHFSLRSLTRCLQNVKQHGATHGLRRAMYEGMQMSFFTVLDLRSQQLAGPAVERYLISSAQAKRAMLAQRPKMLANPDKFVVFEHHLIPKGQLPCNKQSDYVITKSVKQNLMNLARASSMRKFPVLLQGPTSAGKTSMIEYLAKYSGNKFVRINNHEHTDLQEYLGSYASSSDGKLEYREGILVEALRQGHWIVLDELNLAPSDVLEALNRLLDDNRELLIPETQEIVRPHPNFMLFATQNPAGLYGGRKRLSRAFRNRFMEIHVDDIPEDELEVILKERARIAPPFCRQIVDVYKKLSLQRQSSRLFEARNSFATLRDLFRWASRPVDDREQLAYHGFMLLAERVRDPTEKEIVRTIIETTLNVKIDDDQLYDRISLPQTNKITWTRAMKRLFVLVEAALQNNEPVLLVGETGCGKTQICQCIAEAYGKQLNIYNAHSNTETADLIGSQRPIRHKSELAQTIVQELSNLGKQYMSSRTADNMGVDELITHFKAMDTSEFDQRAVNKIQQCIVAYQSLFAWSDGSLVRAMKEGSFFLLDEISLADDSVLERMNSLLEPARSILLAEKGADDSFVVAEPGFQFLATMNPGGDYGKRELSAALRNRLTEIWVPPLSNDEDVVPILEARLCEIGKRLATVMVQFAHCFISEIQSVQRTAIPLRTLLAWADFVSLHAKLGVELAVVHGAAMTFIDSLGANPAGLASHTMDDLASVRDKCLAKLSELIHVDARMIYDAPLLLVLGQDHLTLGPFSIPRLPTATVDDLVFEAPTTLKNGMRIIRALQTNRPLLLEGNPGVGKTAIVSSLAKLCGRQLTRINLSDQTDLMDLFGADAPATEKNFGGFVWRDGPLLSAMQSGHWVLLDEMNLASQSVLEGLNACLDHRQEVYIAELDKTFKCHPNFTLFATQNPHHQGGGRKGLPSSFVNRFTVVYADPFTRDDLLLICKLRYPSVPEAIIEKVVTAVDSSQYLILRQHEFSDGGPWEVNLRDLNRWLSLCKQDDLLEPSAYFDTVISHRFRNPLARELAVEQCRALLGHEAGSLYHSLTPRTLQVGFASLSRDELLQRLETSNFIHTRHLAAAKSMIIGLNQRWPLILVGASNSGKTSLIRSLAALSGSRLMEFSINADTDAADLIGGYEQYEYQRDVAVVQNCVKSALVDLVCQNFAQVRTSELYPVLSAFDRVQKPGIQPTELLDILQPLGQIHKFSDWHTLQEVTQKVQELRAVTNIASTKFVWNDGILVDAAETGSWLVLDNANLCNPSVLDRLNSLLEPDGKLIISEQHNSNGEVRIVQPHPDFRIILTMDPRYGELSRAMRNRSLEIFLDGQLENMTELPLPKYPSESSIARLRPLALGSAATAGSSAELEPWIENLSTSELNLVQIPNHQAFGETVKKEAALLLSPRITSFAAWDKFRNMMAGLERADFKDRENPFSPWIDQPLIQLYVPTYTRLNLRRLARWQYVLTVLLRSQAYLATIAASALQKSDNLTWLESTVPAVINRRRQKQSHMVSGFTFAHSLMEFGFEFAESMRDRWSGEDVYTPFHRLVYLLRDVIHLFDQTTLNDVQIPAYVQVAAEINVGLINLSPQLSGKFLQIVSLLGNTRDLEKFQSLQRMWPVWRGGFSSSETELDTRLAVEKMIKCFDAICHYTSLPLAHLANVRSRLLKLLDEDTTHADFHAQLQILSHALDELSLMQSKKSVGPSHFAAIFRMLFRKSACSGMDRLNVEAQKWAILGGQSSEARFDVIQKTSAGEVLSKLMICSPLQIDVSIGEAIQPEEIALQELSRLFSDFRDQPIRRMHQSGEEISELARALSSTTRILTTQNLQFIRANALRLLWDVLQAHREFLSESSCSTIDAGPRSDVDPVRLLMEAAGNAQQRGQQELGRRLGECLAESALCLGGELSYESCGRGLLMFASTVLSFLVVDKTFDPAQYPVLLRKRYEKRRSEQHIRIAAWKSFQLQYCGQDSSFIIDMLKADLLNMGAPPIASPVYRPDNVHLEQLAAELLNLQRNILSNTEVLGEILSGSAHTRISSGPAILRKIWTCVQRLLAVHRAYDDLVKPIVSLLHVMALGIRMIIYESQRTIVNTSHSSLDQLRNWTFDYCASLLQPNGELPAYAFGSQKTPQFWEYLRQLRLKLAIGRPRKSDRARLIKRIVEIMGIPYSMWAQQVDKDREEAEAKSRYYSYRSGDDPDGINEADVKLEFPDFETNKAEIDGNLQSHEDGERQVSDDNHTNVQDTAIELARYHRSLFVEGDYQEMLRSYLRGLMHPADEFHSGFQAHEILTPDILPSVLVITEQQMEAFASGEGTTLNIYTDSNIIETRKLFKIVTEVQSRFVEIGQAWPEHATPIEVCNFCDELLDLKMNDPIAKLLTKAEKLLQIVAQWQAIASREWSVVNIVDSLTGLIIHWRRLELGSWSRLLDIEDQKQKTAAELWYFIAYEAVIYKTLIHVEHSAESKARNVLVEFRRDLAKTLEEFLKFTTLGQYSSRLELLKVFARTLGGIADDYINQWLVKQGTKKPAHASGKPQTVELRNEARPFKDATEFAGFNRNFHDDREASLDGKKEQNDILEAKTFNDNAAPIAAERRQAREINEIRDVIINVVNHHARYESQVKKTLAEGRNTLEKDINEQIKLASWKDTNVTALKESARRSHFKLFRTVKKYRTLLAQPVINFDANYSANDVAVTSRKITSEPVLSTTEIKRYVQICAENILDWNDRPDRLKNPLGAAITVRHVYTAAHHSMSPTVELTSYLDYLTSSAQELRKATPGLLTDENTTLVRDLKQRKRKLLADTMKEVAKMGVRRNIGARELATQSSTAEIFCNLPTTLSDEDSVQSDRIGEAFHELLDILPSAREAAIKHSEELTSGEVTRGLGYLEGFLALSIRQHTQLCELSRNLQEFEQTKRLLDDLQQLPLHDLVFVSEDNDDQLAGLLSRTAWLPTVLGVYAGILDFQEKQSGSATADFGGELRKFGPLIQEHHRELSNLPSLPAGLSSTKRVDMAREVHGTLNLLRSHLERCETDQPELGAIVSQLRKWVSFSIKTDVTTTNQELITVSTFDEMTRHFSDKIFVALQQATEALKNLPASTEDQGWLARSTECYGRATASLHLETLQDSLQFLLSSLQFLGTRNLPTGIALLVVASPVIQQFSAICQDLQSLMANLYLHTTRLAVFLGKSFTNLAREGFCSPSEKSDDQQQPGKVEQGTGLGEGEGAEDISKDVGDDEDLTDLAQQPGDVEKNGEDIEKNKDAVDIGADDLEGQMESGQERNSEDDDDGVSDDEDRGSEMNEETGSVDDLDPGAVDEKMWDDMQKEAEKEEKEMKSQKAQGQKTDDQAAKTEGDQQSEGDDIEANEHNEAGEDAEDDEGQQRAGGENVDPYLQEEQALDLPEDMQLNGEEEKEDKSSDIDMDDLSDMKDDGHPDNQKGDDESADEDMVDHNNSIEQEENAGEDDEELTNGLAKDDEIVEDQTGNEDEAQDATHETREDDEMGEAQDQANGESGVADASKPDLDAQMDENAPSGQNETETAAQESEPQKGKQSSAQEQDGTNSGTLEQGIGRQEGANEKQNDALKKIADVLEKFHQRREIFTASESRLQDQNGQDIDMADADFEHIDDETQGNDAQALGTADQDIPQNIDQSRAIEDSRAKTDENLPMPKDRENTLEAQQETVIERFNRRQDERDEKENEKQQARGVTLPDSIHDRRQQQTDEDSNILRMDEDIDDETQQQTIQDRSTHQLTICGSTTTMADAQHLWSLTSNKTQSLSLVLTEQLRLILQPTTATKLRGDFRTGKRLNIRRIIPYIASGYKRDKIWMRRSVPSKRNYQIMLAVDDSKSMAESGADILALETLCMLSRSLSMLEVGELCIVAFGSNYPSGSDDDDDDDDDDGDNKTSTQQPDTTARVVTGQPPSAIKLAHPFSVPFSPNQSGPETFSSFTFDQPATNIRALLSESISLFHKARLESSARETAADLWQLQIIISDGHIGSDPDDSVCRLVRQAREQKIMCVFVIVDSGAESIVDLNEVLFETTDPTAAGEPKITTRRYLEHFPFQYYVVVRDVRDLPGVLSRVLKGWFEGVVETG